MKSTDRFASGSRVFFVLIFVPVNSSKVISPIQWLVSSKQYLDAVDQLALKDVENAFQVRQTAPVLTLLAYAFEQILKSSSYLHQGDFEHIHDLIKLWESTDSSVKEEVPTWTKEFIDFNQKNFLDESLDAALQLDKNLGQPNGSFEENLIILNNWTWRSVGPVFEDNKMGTDDFKFLGRYPQVGVMQDGIVDVRFLFEIARKIISFLHPKAMAYHKENSK